MIAMANGDGRDTTAVEIRTRKCNSLLGLAVYDRYSPLPGNLHRTPSGDPVVLNHDQFDSGSTALREGRVPQSETFSWIDEGRC